MLAGHRTYIAAILTICGFWGAYLSGAFSIEASIHATIDAVLAVTLRRGIARDLPPSVEKKVNKAEAVDALNKLSDQSV